MDPGGSSARGCCMDADHPLLGCYLLSLGFKGLGLKGLGFRV